MIRKNWKHISATLLLLCLLLACSKVWAQQPPGKEIALARQFLRDKEYEKALPLFKKVYEQAPFDKGVYDEYLDALLLAAKYDDAAALVDYMSKIRREDPSMLLDMGRVLDASGKKKKAEEQYEKALALVSGEDFRTRQLADAFVRIGRNDYAIRIYERARTMIQNPYVYATELGLLYSKEGNTDEAIKAMMDQLVVQPNVLDDVKSALLQMIGDDGKKMALLQKQLGKRIAQQPDNPYWTELMTWIYMQKGDFKGAYAQITGLDKQLKEEGERVVLFSKTATAAGQYAIALDGFGYVMAKGSSGPMYEEAWDGKIQVLLRQLEQKRPVDQKLLAGLQKEYTSFFDEYPQYITSPLLRDYARVEARYALQVDTAIALLERAIGAPNARRDFVGYCKLDLGDYYLLKEKVWDATLVYSQVDKAFKEDQLGEEARFRNAKLAYYRGDFKWAQTQLSVLKASTSELIANDALYLSVLITENIPPDSNLTPLLRFAAADLLLFQNQTQASDRLLDSIAKAFPETALMDDIYMLRARIAEDEGRNDDAVAYLEKILSGFGDDVLGDDAAFRLAVLYEERLKDKARALQYYETLITRYPGSTYIQVARVRYQKLKAGKEPSS
ncbi:tetratricopeptide repeat protein [Taibaiella koreensis]|uniref:tetratricopeptide repeat protein n=1 Tax=Taibaiella koreensis TaxID=1268548 RepID=UPI000E59FAB5|nr:tetratricopeptide repeat protein [Taibaiella koreensis]